MMKLLFILSILLVYTFSYAEDAEFNRMRTLPLSAKVERVLSEEYANGTIDRDRALTLVYYHIAESYNAKNVDIERTRQLLEEIRPQILNASESNAGERAMASELLPYLKQDPIVEGAILQLANDPEPDVYMRALDGVFEMGVAPAEMREELVSEILVPRTRGAFNKLKYGGLASSRSGRWGLTEAVPYLIEKLKLTYEKEGRIDGCIVSLKEMGPDAAEALPLLYSLLEQRQADGNAHIREIDALEHAIARISVATDNASTNPVELESMDEDNEDVINVIEKVDVTDIVLATPTAPKSESERTSWWVWAFLVLIAVFVLGIIARKSKS